VLEDENNILHFLASILLKKQGVKTDLNNFPSRVQVIIPTTNL